MGEQKQHRFSTPPFLVSIHAPDPASIARSVAVGRKGELPHESMPSARMVAQVAAITALFDDLIGSHQHCRRHCHAECFQRLFVNREMEPGRLLER